MKISVQTNLHLDFGSPASVPQGTVHAGGYCVLFPEDIIHARDSERSDRLLQRRTASRRLDRLENHIHTWRNRFWDWLSDSSSLEDRLKEMDQCGGRYHSGMD